MKKSFFIALLLFAIALDLCPAAAWAAGSAPHNLSIEETYKYWPHFLAFCVLFYYLIKKPFLEVWEARTIRIAEEASAGERKLAEAKDRLALAKERYTGLKAEVAELKQKANEETEREVAAVLSEAAERADAIAKQAGETIAAEKLLSEQDLQKEFADKVIEQARQKLQGSISDADDKVLRDSLLGGLGTLRN